MIIKTYASNWEIFNESERLLNIPTDSDSVNSGIFESVQEVATSIIADLAEVGYICTEEEKTDILTKCNIYFSDRF